MPQCEEFLLRRKTHLQIFGEHSRVLFEHDKGVKSNEVFDQVPSESGSLNLHEYGKQQGVLQ